MVKLGLSHVLVADRGGGERDLRGGVPVVLETLPHLKHAPPLPTKESTRQGLGLTAKKARECGLAGQQGAYLYNLTSLEEGKKGSSGQLAGEPTVEEQWS